MTLGLLFAIIIHLDTVNFMKISGLNDLTNCFNSFVVIFMCMCYTVSIVEHGMKGYILYVMVY